MKTARINWQQVPQPRREELKRLAAAMKRRGYVKIQLNFHGNNKWSIDGFNAAGGVWIG